MGGLLIGFYEQACRTWGLDGIDPHVSSALCPDDLDCVSDVLEGAFARMPALTETGIRQVFNGPIVCTAHAAADVRRRPPSPLLTQDRDHLPLGEPALPHRRRPRQRTRAQTGRGLGEHVTLKSMAMFVTEWPSWSRLRRIWLRCAVAALSVSRCLASEHRPLSGERPPVGGPCLATGDVGGQAGVAVQKAR